MRYFFLTVMLFSAFLSFTQNEFSGKVVDENDDPLTGIVIFREENGILDITGNEGEFSFYHDSMKVEVTLIGLDAKQTHNLTAKTFEALTFSIATISIEPLYITIHAPLPTSKVRKEELERNNTGQDVPFLLKSLPSVTTTSDAGVGVGYTGMRIRGIDATRINVTINGVPLNDAESQGVFWVDLPDIAASLEDITVVRGVGTSVNGAGAFGASVHLNTASLADSAFSKLNHSMGSFNSWRNAFHFNSGKISNKWHLNGRVSKLNSDGFIDRASSDLSSYFLSAGYQTNGGNVEFITFSGKEITYQAWNGVPEHLLESNRTFNSFTYENQVDSYKQDHYQLHVKQKLTSQFHLQAALHYTKGDGFFEEFRENDELADYDIPPVMVGNEVLTHTDIVRQRWLENDFFGAIATVDYFKDYHTIKLGSGVNKYRGDHFGTAIQADFVPYSFLNQNYYFNDAKKNEANFYMQYTWQASPAFKPYVDIQYRTVNYKFVGKALTSNNQVVELPQSISHQFFNPKLGFTYHPSNAHTIYAFVAVAQKEPNRNDYVDAPSNNLPKPEKLIDYELGYKVGDDAFGSQVNFYYLNYKDQLALTGGVNDVGEYTRVNIPDSYRAGVEVEANKTWLNNKLNTSINATFSCNKIDAFTEQLDNFDTGIPESIYHENTGLALSPNVIAGGKIAYQFGDDMNLSLHSKYVGRQFLDNTSSDNRLIDAYFLNDLLLHKKWQPKLPFMDDIALKFHVKNVFNHAYESNGYTFGYIFNGNPIYEEFYYPQAGRHFFAGLDITF